MKITTWAFVWLFLFSGVGLLVNNSGITGNVISEENIIMCKNTLDCPSSSQCCYFDGTTGGICGSAHHCEMILHASQQVSGFTRIVEQAGAHLFFSPFNGILLFGVMTGLVGVVRTLHTDKKN